MRACTVGRLNSSASWHVPTLCRSASCDAVIVSVIDDLSYDLKNPEVAIDFLCCVQCREEGWPSDDLLTEVLPRYPDTPATPSYEDKPGKDSRVRLPAVPGSSKRLIKRNA